MSHNFNGCYRGQVLMSVWAVGLVSCLALVAAGCKDQSPKADTLAGAAQIAVPATENTKTFDLQHPIAQTISLGKFVYAPNKAGQVKFQILLQRGQLSGSLVLKMLSKDGEDLAPDQKLLGWYDPTRTMALPELKAGSPVQIAEDFVSGPGTAMVGVELKLDVKSPGSLAVTDLKVEARAGEAVSSDEGGQLVTQPEKDFAYAANLLPPLDSPQWRFTGDAAKRVRGPGGQTVLALEEKSSGTWESPVAPLPQGARELCLQTFMKFDRLATPFDHPYKIVYRDRDGKSLSKPARPSWPVWEWNTAYGQWIPLSIRSAVPEQAASVQVVIQLNKGLGATGWGTGEMARNNYIVFQTAGLRLWSQKAPSPAGMSPYNFTAWAGSAADAGPFVPCSPQQQNSIALWTCINDTSNLYFSKEGKWPTPRAKVENYLPVRRTIDLKGQVLDWTGRPIGNVSCSVKVEPFECKNVDLPIDAISRSGTYSLNLDAMQDGATVGQGVIRWGYFSEPSDRPDRRDLQYPFCFHSSYSAQGGDPPQYMDLVGRTMRAMGVRGFRLQCRLWGLNGVDADKAIASVREYSDRFHKEVWPFMQKYGFDGYITFFPKPRAPVPAAGSPELEAWKKYVTAAVKLYPEISVFAFGNEEVGRRNTDVDVKPGVWGYTGSMRDFTREFLAAREAALQARPEITFIVGQASDPDGNVAKRFFEAGGTAKDVQGWAINSYVRSAATWRNLSDILRQHGVDLTNAVGLIPEIGSGVPRRGPNRATAEKGEAISLVINHVEILTAAPWVRDINWFTLVSRGPVVHNFVFDTDWSPKPMVGAYLTMSSTLGAGRPTRVAELPGVNAYLWQRPDGSKVGILWSSGRQRVRLQVGQASEPVIVRDLMGNDTALTPKGGVISAEVSESPIYLLNIQTLKDGSDTSEAWTLERTSDDQWQAKVEIRNRTDRPLSIGGHFEGPSMVVWSHPEIISFSLAPGSSRIVVAPFTLREKNFTDAKTLTLMLDIDGDHSASDFATTLLTARRTQTPPAFDGGGKGWAKGDVVVMDQLRQVVTNATPRWKGPDDLSARCTTLWDDQRLYFRAVVKDDTDVHLTPPDRTHMNDNIQLAFMVNGADADAGGVDIALGASDNKPTAYRFTGKTGAVDNENIRLNLRRDEDAKVTIYEAAIAWKAIGIDQPHPGLRFRFGILVDDSDRMEEGGIDRQGIQWSNGVFHRSPSRLADLTLCD